jgi:hypothetical protein
MDILSIERFTPPKRHGPQRLIHRFKGTLMVQINWRVPWQNSVWYALAAGLTRCGTRTDDRLGVHAAQQSSGLLAPLFDYYRLSLKRLNAILKRLATQATWETPSVPSENEIGVIVAEELDDLPLGRRFNYFLAPRLQRLFTAVYEAAPLGSRESRRDQSRTFFDVRGGDNFAVRFAASSARAVASACDSARA